MTSFSKKYSNAEMISHRAALFAHEVENFIPQIFLPLSTTKPTRTSPCNKNEQMLIGDINQRSH